MVMVGLALMLVAPVWAISWRVWAEDETKVGTTHRIKRGDLVVTIDEQGILESEENFEIKSKVRGYNAVLWIIESGSFVKKGDELLRLDDQAVAVLQIQFVMRGPTDVTPGERWGSILCFVNRPPDGGHCR